jgi:hypothetical protein
VLHFWDIILSIVHLAIIIFNLFGWIPKNFRKAHLISILLTAASWLLLGIWFGVGYCPVTDLQWEIKERLGEQNIPANFIEYFAEKIANRDFNPQLVNNAITISFIIVALLSFYFNFLAPSVRKRKQIMV